MGGRARQREKERERNTDEEKKLWGRYSARRARSLRKLLLADMGKRARWRLVGGALEKLSKADPPRAFAGGHVGDTPP